MTTTIELTELTTGALEGTGIFDALMRANKAHLEAEFQKNRIKGAEYSTVYLGSLQAVMQAAISFLLTKQKAAAEVDMVRAQIQLVNEQVLNAVKEGKVLDATKCKLDAEYDLLLAQKLKTDTEIILLTNKIVTEKAQTTAIGVDADSVLGRQKALYKAQTDGFARDAEQKAATVLVDSWKVRRTTDEGTVADATNKLDDATIGRAVTKLLAGVNA